MTEFKIGEKVLTRYGYSKDKKSLELLIIDVIKSHKHKYIYFFDEISSGIIENELISLNDIKNSELNKILKY